MKTSKQRLQKGFSLFEVLIAMLVAAVGIGALMNIHTQNLRQVHDNAELKHGQLLLDNMVHRVQHSADNGTLDADKNSIKQAIEQQATDAGLRTPIATLMERNGGQLLQLQWDAHDTDDAVVRKLCNSAESNRHCLALWIAP